MNNVSDDLFGEVLTDMANGPKLTSHADLTGSLMRRLAEKGLSLDDCSDRRVMGRSRRTLEARARQAGIAFPDYVPMAMRKLVTLVQRGDFYEVLGERAPEVAKLCGIVLLGSDAAPTCAFPAHAIDDARDQLKAAFYIVKIVRAKKARDRKVAA